MFERLAELGQGGDLDTIQDLLRQHFQDETLLVYAVHDVKEALYFYLAPLRKFSEKIAKTKRASDDKVEMVLLDYDKSDTLIGIEIIGKEAAQPRRHHRSRDLIGQRQNSLPLRPAVDDTGPGKRNR